MQILPIKNQPVSYQNLNSDISRVKALIQAVKSTVSAKEAIAIVQDSPDVEMAFYIYVVNEDEQLMGVASLRQLVTTKPETPLEDLGVRLERAQRFQRATSRGQHDHVQRNERPARRRLSGIYAEI